MPDRPARPGGEPATSTSSTQTRRKRVDEKIVQVVTERIPRRFGLDPVAEVQVLPDATAGALGALSLNVELQKAAEPGERRASVVERFGCTYAPGDKVMQTVNDYDKDVFNGDIGFVTAIDPDAEEMLGRLRRPAVSTSFGELDEVALAYATTIHKSQGSEYPAVVIPITTQHYMMLERNLLYTGITRGKQLVVLVGQKKAIAIAVRGARDRRRWSKLRRALATELIRGS